MLAMFIYEIFVNFLCLCLIEQVLSVEVSEAESEAKLIVWSSKCISVKKSYLRFLQHGFEDKFPDRIISALGPQFFCLWKVIKIDHKIKSSLPLSCLDSSRLELPLEYS